jgi:hypothetical protein
MIRFIYQFRDRNISEIDHYKAMKREKNDCMKIKIKS